MMPRIEGTQGLAKWPVVERTHERPFAFVLGILEKYFSERQDAERAVFFGGVRPVRVGVDDDDLACRGPAGCR